MTKLLQLDDFEVGQYIMIAHGIKSTLLPQSIMTMMGASSADCSQTDKRLNGQIFEIIALDRPCAIIQAVSKRPPAGQFLMPAGPGSPYAAKREAAVNLADYSFVEVRDSNYLEKFKQYWGDTTRAVTLTGVGGPESLTALFSQLLRAGEDAVNENSSGEQNDGTSDEAGEDPE